MCCSIDALHAAGQQQNDGRRREPAGLQCVAAAVPAVQSNAPAAGQTAWLCSVDRASRIGLPVGLMVIHHRRAAIGSRWQRSGCVLRVLANFAAVGARRSKRWATACQRGRFKRRMFSPFWARCWGAMRLIWSVSQGDKLSPSSPPCPTSSCPVAAGCCLWRRRTSWQHFREPASAVAAAASVERASQSEWCMGP